MAASSPKVTAPSNNARSAVVERQRFRGSAEVIPFPVMRRTHFINNAWVATAHMTDREATDYFKSIIHQHRAHLERLGVSADRVAAEVHELTTMFGTTKAA
jgi:Family of unknown function (DUF6074)